MDIKLYPIELVERFLSHVSTETLRIMCYNEETKELILKILSSNTFWKYKVEAKLGYQIEMEFTSQGNNSQLITWKGIYNTLSVDVNMNVDVNLSFTQAIEKGYSNTVALLLNDERVDPTANNNFAFLYASQNGYTEIVVLLLKFFTTNSNNNNYPYQFAIDLATIRGHIEIVDLLLQYTCYIPDVNINNAIISAITGGYIKIVSLFLKDPRINSQVDNSYLIYLASRSGYPEILTLLKDSSR